MHKYLLLLIPLILLSCTTEKFTFSVDTDAKVIGNTNDHIGIQYEIYGKTIFQDIQIETHAELSYYAKLKTIPITVFVEGNDFDGANRVFITLTHNGSTFGKREQYLKLSMNDFTSRDLEIPGFTWYVFNDEEYDNGVSPRELRLLLGESGDKPPEETVTVTIDEKKGGDQEL